MTFNLVTLLTAGYETTSSALTFCCFVLANNPNELTKLQDELDANFNSKV